jgi:tungstate transport system ATP-binding protein
MAEAPGIVLAARSVSVRLGNVTALREVDLAIAKGRRIVVLGANGAGKSVLLRTLHGLLVPAGGEIVTSVDRAHQGMVFQRPVLLRRSVLANVEYALAVRGVGRRERAARARDAIGRVWLGHLAERQARVLSGGEQQRVALARAWALEPALLFLDEPTASLDPAAASEIERVVGEIHASGTTVVMATHNLGLARRFADEIVLLHAGRVAEVAPADRFFAAPASREAALFLEGELPWPPATHP